MDLRQTWARKLRDALTYLENLNTPIAKKTLALVRSGKVIVLNFSQFTLEDYRELHEEMYDQKCKHVVPSKRVIDDAKEQFMGIIYQNRIYIQEDLTSIEEIARIIVHEVNHYLNDSNNHYKTELEQFIEELRAEIAEDLLSQNVALTPAYLRTKSEMVIRTRELDLKPRCLSKEAKERVLRGLRY